MVPDYLGLTQVNVVIPIKFPRRCDQVSGLPLRDGPGAGWEPAVAREAVRARHGERNPRDEARCPAFLTHHIQMLTFISGMRVVVVWVDC